MSLSNHVYLAKSVLNTLTVDQVISDYYVTQTCLSITSRQTLIHCAKLGGALFTLYTLDKVN